jgi:hypothetical protein
MQTSMVCDYPGCGNPISARCNLCGRAMCTRHIQWIGTQGSDGVYTSAHFRCDICAYHVALANQAKRRRAIRLFSIAVGLGIVSYIMFQLDITFQLDNALGELGFFGCGVALLLAIFSLALGSTIRQ